MSAADAMPGLSQILMTSGGLALLALVPMVLVSATCLAKFMVVFGLLRTALGLPQTPPALVLTTLSLVLTVVVMEPVLGAVWGELLLHEWDMEEALADPAAFGLLVLEVLEPWRAFLEANAGEGELAFLAERAGVEWGSEPLPWRVVVPGFALSELADALRIGVLLLLPFLVLDLVIGTLLLALGMHMLNPTSVSLPFKLLLFLGVGGWLALTESLVLGYHLPGVQ